MEIVLIGIIGVLIIVFILLLWRIKRQKKYIKDEKQISNSEKTDLLDQLHKSKEQINHLEEVSHVKESSIPVVDDNQSNKLIEKYKDKIENLEKRLIDISSTSSKGSEDNQYSFRDLNDKIKDLEGEVGCLEDNIKTLNSSLENETNQQLGLNDKILNLETALEALKQDKADSNLSLEKDKQQQLVLNNKIEELEKELVGLKLEKDVLNSSLEEEKKQKLELETKIEKFEEELEDLEDEIEDLNTSLDKETKKRQNLEKELVVSEEKHHKLSLMHNQTISDLERANSQLLQAKQSTDFLNEVLEARIDDTDADSSSRLGVVDKILNKALYSFIPTLEQCSKQAYEDNIADNLEQDLIKWAALERKSWIKNKVTISFIGEFSAGKTSIVNRILEESNNGEKAPKLPVSSKATTAIPTYISWDARFSSKFVTPRDEVKVISTATFKNVDKSILERIKVSPLIKYFVVGYKNDNLKNISILDTPGFSSNDKEDAIRTLEVVNESDALFWVVDVNSGELNKKSLDIIRQNLTKPLYIIINKVDTKTSSEVNQVKAKILKTLNSSSINVVDILLFSNRNNPRELLDLFKTLSFEDAQSPMLDRLQSCLEDQLKVSTKCYEKYLKYVTKLEGNFKESRSVIEDEHDNIIESLEILLGYPSFKSKWLSANCYEMTKDDYSDFCEVIVNINKYSQNLLSIVGLSGKQEHLTLIENREEYPGAIESLKNNENDVEQLQNCISELKKLIVMYNKCIDKNIK